MCSEQLQLSPPKDFPSLVSSCRNMETRHGGLTKLSPGRFFSWVSQQAGPVYCPPALGWVSVALLCHSHMLESFFNFPHHRGFTLASLYGFDLRFPFCCYVV